MQVVLAQPKLHVQGAKGVPARLPPCEPRRLKRFRLAQQENRLGEYYPREIKEIPDHGCYENLSKAVASYGIFPEDIPSPFNLNQHMKIDGVTGKMEHTQIRPKDGNYMDIRAEMDLLVALSACPDLPVGGKPVDVVIYQS